MKRAPSMRELRRRCPANVVILPTAAERQVKQQHGRAYGVMKRALLASQGVEFPFQWPVLRDIEREALRDANNPQLRPDVPPFDPSNPAHLRAWESVYDLGRQQWKSDGDR